MLDACVPRHVRKTDLTLQSHEWAVSKQMLLPGCQFSEDYLCVATKEAPKLRFPAFDLMRLGFLVSVLSAAVCAINNYFLNLAHYSWVDFR